MKLFYLLALLAHSKCFMSQSVKVEEITTEAQRCELGEGPHWDAGSKSLFYVDIVAPAIFRYDTKNGEIYKATIKDNETLPLGFIIPIEGTTDEFIVGAGRELTVIKWNGKSGQATVVKVIGEVEKDFAANRINDAKCDPHGRLYFGTIGDENTNLKENPTGALYRFDNSSIVKLKGLVGVGNGLTWDEKVGKFYYIDSVTRDVKVFDYDSSNGNISNESVLIDFQKLYTQEFLPDGMTIDENGTLYVATWGGRKIYVVDPKTKTVIKEIDIPTDQVTSVAFGGTNLDILYVTTAGKPKPKPAPAGGLFKITGLAVKGLPMSRFRLY